MIRIFFFLVFSFYAAVTFASVNGGEAVEIGGIKQWVTFQGPSQSAPVLLFLHGGPGNSVLAYSGKFTNQLTKHFLVVHWDQRESGKTANLNSSQVPLTVERMEADAVELVRYLRQRFSQNKIYLMGHSWGGFLALAVAARHAELLTACFAISPMVHQVESERLALQWMLAEADRTNAVQAKKELGEVEVPFQNTDQLYFHRKWLNAFRGEKSPSKTFVNIWGKKWFGLFSQASQVNYFSVAPEINCPVYFFLGANDYQTNSKLTESYYQQLICEGKKLYWFADSAHNPHLTETAKFQNTTINILNQN